MRKIKRHILLLLGILFFVSNTNGQSLPKTDDYIANVQYFSTEDGLSHRAVYTTFQDSKGFIWFGTQNGLNRFNGKQFEIFTKEKHGLADNQINLILEDADGWLWIFQMRSNSGQTRFLHLSFINIHTLEVKTIEERFGATFPMPVRNLYTAMSSDKKVIYLGSETGQVIRFHPSYGFIVKRLQEEGTIGLNALSDLHNTIIAKVQDSTIMGLDTLFNVAWEKTDTNINWDMMTKDNKELLWLRKKEENIRHFKDLNFHTSAFDPNFKAIEISKGLFDTIVLSRYQKYYYDKNLDIFWYDDDAHTFIFHPDRGIVYDFKNAYPEITNSRTFQIYFDNRNNAWLATETGVFKIQLNLNPFKKYLALPTKDYNIIKATSTRGILRHENKLWVHNVNGITTEIDLTNHQTISSAPFKTTYDGTDHLVSNFTSVPFDDEHILFGGEGIGLLNTKTKKYELIRSKLIWDTEKNWQFFKDKKNTIWAGKTNYGGLSYWNTQKDSLVQFTQYNDFPKIAKSTIYDFLEWDEERTLIASSSGIYILHLSDGIIGHFGKNEAIGNQLPFNDIYHLHQDRDDSNVLWVATAGGGLLRLKVDPPNLIIEASKQLTIADGLSSNVIYAVYEDDFGNLWMPSDYGIIRLNKTTFSSKAFTVQDGISHNEFNRISHFQDTDGTLYFGGLNGVTAFHPKDISNDKDVLDAPLHITKFQEYDDNEGIMIDRTLELIQEPRIILPPSYKLFNLEFALLEYQESSQVRYSYQIIGHSDNWIYLDENRLRINGLPYGKYTLNIRGQGADGQFSSQQLSIPIIVQYPFYLKWWFILSLILSAIGLTILIFKWRTRLLQKSKKDLEKTVKERTAIIAAQTEELRNLDQVKSRFFANVSHELRTPLTLMLAPIENVLDHNRLENKDYTQLLLAQRNGKQLNKMIDEILALTKLESGKLELHEEPTIWYNFLRRTIANFESLANRKNIQFSFQYEGNEYLNVLIDPQKVETILVNLLSNAFKFTTQGSIRLHVKEQSEYLMVKIVDTGSGIHPNDLPYIFDRFYQTKEKNRTAAGGTGIGLAFSKKLIDLMEGEIQVESKLGEGATFILKIPKVEVISQTNTEDVLLVQAAKIKENPTVFQKESNKINDSSQSKETILLVEDNDDMRDFIKSLLVDKYHIITAENGKIALEKIPAANCQLILSDIMMPIMDGYQLLEHLKSSDDYRHLPVIMLTASGGMDDKLKALRIGVDDYMLKPFNKEELLVRIENLLKNAENRNTPFENEEEEIISTSSSNDTPKLVISQEDQIWLEEVENTIRENLSSFQFNVAVLAHKVALSDRQLSRKIKKLTGLSVGNYIREIRFDTARRSLENGTAKSVKAITYDIGMKSVKNFSIQFKERFGKLPSEYL